MLSKSSAQPKWKVGPSLLLQGSQSKKGRVPDPTELAGRQPGMPRYERCSKDTVTGLKMDNECGEVSCGQLVWTRGLLQ